MAIWPQSTHQLQPTGCPVPTVTGIARRLGWLERDGLDGAIQEHPNAAALWARAEGAATRLVALTWVDVFQGVLTLPGNRIETPDQLAGRRLALPLRELDGIDLDRATARRGFHAATALSGLFSDEVTWVDVPVAQGAPAAPYAAETAALLRGEVDAIHVSGPVGRALAARLGAVVVVDLGAHLDPMVRTNAATPLALTVRQRLLDEQPERVARALATLLRAGAWAELHAAEVAAAVAEQTDTSPRAVAAAYRGALQEQLYADLSARKLAALSWQKDFLLTHGFLAGDVQIAAWTTLAPLAAARELLAR